MTVCIFYSLFIELQTYKELTTYNFTYRGCSKEVKKKNQDRCLTLALASYECRICEKDTEKNIKKSENCKIPHYLVDIKVYLNKFCQNGPHN